MPYLEQLGVRYHMLSKPIIDMAKTCMDPKRPSLCSFCSRMKRGMLYSCMREHATPVSPSASTLMTVSASTCQRPPPTPYVLVRHSFRGRRPQSTLGAEALRACASRGGGLMPEVGAVVESFVMSAWHNGSLRTMKANYWVQQDDIRVIRPMVSLPPPYTPSMPARRPV